MITSEAQLRALYPPVGVRAQRKQLDHLDPHGQRFVALSPLCVLATGGGAGELLDASPRGGPPGFAKVLDAHTLLLPDSTGNNRLDTLSNLLKDPRIGLLFLIPGVDETLRVNGVARLRDEPEFTGHFAAERQAPTLVIEVQVREAYLHCAKALMRSRLWDVHAQVQRSVLPSMGAMIRDQVPEVDMPQESQAAMLERYQQQLAQEQVPSIGHAAAMPPAGKV